MSVGATGRGYADRAWGFGRAALLAGVAAGALLAAALATPAAAIEYPVSSDAQLQQAILDASTNGDTAAVIVLQNNITLSSNPLNVPSVPITINTGAFTLTGPAGGISFPTTGGQLLTLQGTYVGASGSIGLNVYGNFDPNFVRNEGSISGGAAVATGGIGANVHGAQFTNTATGTVHGGDSSGNTGGAGGIGVQINRGTALVNYGTIEGGDSVSGAGAWGVNAGTGVAGSNTITNYGKILGGDGETNNGLSGSGILSRVSLGQITNNGTGEIVGGNNAFAIGASGATANIDLINSGSIRAGTGQLTAITLSDNVTTGVIRLELRAGSLIEGYVIANANSAAGDLFRLGGTDNSSFDVTSIGAAAQYRNFDSFEKTGTSTWTLTGTTTALTPWQLNGGILAVSSDEALGDTAGALTFNGGALRALSSFTSTRNMVFTGNGGFDVGAGVELTLSGALTGPGGLVKAGAGTLIQNSVRGYDGQTFIADGTLRAGAANVFGGSYSTNSATATLDLNGFDQTVSNLQNFGAVRFGSTPGTTLTVTQGYDGGAGGVVYLNTALGDDNSDTDLLVVEGTAVGATSLVVTNVGGAGAQTGTAGIKVVDVGGASIGSFALVGDYVFEGDQAVVGGAYAYRLYRGTETTDDGDWYLRSEIIDAGPLYAPTVPLYENYLNVLQGFNELGTLEQRVGGRQWLNDEPEASEEGAAAPNAIWGRMDASQAHFSPDASTTGASYDLTTWRLLAGLDGVLQQSEAGTLVAGVNAAFGTVSSDIASIYGAGSVNAIGFGLGGTLTWYGAGGFYLDGQAQLVRYSADIASDDLGSTLVESNQAFGYGLSLEAGQKLGLNDNWSLTPQAQLSYSAVRFDDFADQYGGVVSLDAGGDTLMGRLGLSADYESAWQDASGASKQAHLYGIANLYYDFLDGTTVDVSGTSFVSRNQGLWGGVGVGGSLSWADEQMSVFGEALLRGSVDDFGDNNALGAKLGFNARW